LGFKPGRRERGLPAAEMALDGLGAGAVLAILVEV
jgi:hypothetical protein